MQGMSGVDPRQLVKGWINFNGTGTIEIRDSYNVSSIVDNTTGDYTVNWDRDFANADYAAVVSVNYEGHVLIMSMAADNIRIGFTNSLGAWTDESLFCVIAIK